MNRVDDPTLPSPVKLSRCDNLFRGDEDLGSSLGQPDRFLALADSNARDFPDAPVGVLFDAGRVWEGTSVAVGHLRALTVTELTPKLRPDRRKL